MRYTLVCLLTVCSLALAGCLSHGFSPREVRGNDVSSYLYATETAFAPALVPGAGDPDKTADRVVRPAEVVVVQVGEVAPPSEALEQLRSRKDLFAAVSGVTGIAPGATAYHSHQHGKEAVRDHVQHLRRVAREMGADYLLIFGGTVDTVNRGTPLSMLDATLIGMFIVPSRLLEAEGRASAVLVDVPTGRIVLIASADGRDRSLTPRFGWEGNQKQQLRALRDEIVEDLMKQTVERFKALADSKAAPGAPNVYVE